MAQQSGPSMSNGNRKSSITMYGRQAVTTSMLITNLRSFGWKSSSTKFVGVVPLAKPEWQACIESAPVLSATAADKGAK